MNLNFCCHSEINKCRLIKCSKFLINFPYKKFEMDYNFYKQESDDEDYEHFFLQPAPSPYNIKEKVKQANETLQSENYSSSRELKVKFKEQLVDYEPCTTDDEVVSIESDEENISVQYTEIKNETDEINESIENPRGALKLNMLRFEEIVEVEEEQEEELLVEDDVHDFDGESFDDSLDTVNEMEVQPRKEEIVTETVQVEKEFKIKKQKPASAPVRRYNIDCKNHCIERLDLGLNLSINKLEIKEKPFDCPKLKLQQRKCCENNTNKNQQFLPCYIGLRSEYGLNMTQLERRERRREILRQQQQVRQKMLEEYKARKRQQNEEVFRQWLKDVARRKELCQSKKQTLKSKEIFSPNIVNLSVKCKERPRTAYEFVSSHDVKRPKRNRSSSAQVYIQIPPDLLQKGIRVGELVVSSASISNLRVVAIS